MKNAITHNSIDFFSFFATVRGWEEKSSNSFRHALCIVQGGETREHAVEGPSDREGEPVKCVKVRGYAADDDDDDHDHDDDDDESK